jgi:hypothetical protein
VLTQSPQFFVVFAVLAITPVSVFLTRVTRMKLRNRLQPELVLTEHRSDELGEIEKHKTGPIRDQ